MKKLLFAGAVALSLTSAAFANGTYVAPPAPAACAEDFTPAVYLGIQGGAAHSNWDASPQAAFVNLLGLKLKHDTANIAGRVFVGYDFTKYLAAEFGYFLSQDDEIKVGGTKAADMSAQAFDLVARLNIPLNDNFSAYAKVGPGYLMMKNSGYDSKEFDVVYGVGVNYAFNQNWNVDVSWTRYNSGETDITDKDWQPNVDFYALGVTYKFVGF